MVFGVKFCLCLGFLLVLGTAFVVISGIIILLARFAFATYAYVSSHDGDWNVAHIFSSHEFWDMEEASYWEWAALTCLIIWIAIFLGFFVLWLINFCCRSMCKCATSDGVSWLIDSSQELSDARTQGLNARYKLNRMRSNGDDDDVNINCIVYDDDDEVDV